MPWDGGGTFSRTDGTRQGSTVWDQARQADADINSADHDAHDQDLADGLNNALTKDGQNSPSVDLPMDGRGHTGVRDAAANNEYASYGQVLALTTPFVPAANVGGTADAITVAPSPAFTAYVAGRGVRFFAAAANTGEATLAVSGLAPVALRRANGAALRAGDIPAGRHVIAIYDGAQFRSDVFPTGTEGAITEAEALALIAAAVRDFAESDLNVLVPDARIEAVSGSKVTGTIGENVVPPLNGSKIASGTVDPQRLGTGGDSSGTARFLREDGTYADPFPEGVLSQSLADPGTARTAWSGFGFVGLMVTGTKPKIRVTRESGSAGGRVAFEPAVLRSTNEGGAGTQLGEFPNAETVVTFTSADLTPGIYIVFGIPFGRPGVTFTVESVA